MRYGGIVVELHTSELVLQHKKGVPLWALQECPAFRRAFVRIVIKGMATWLADGRRVAVRASPSFR